MRIVVSDTSCLIDLKEGALLAPCFALPFQFVMPTELFDSELLSFTDDEKQYLRVLGLETRDLDSDQMSLAYEHRQKHRALTVRDCYALALVQTIDDAILFTGDRNLRKKSESLEIKTHGVIWAVDQLLELGCCTPKEGLTALIYWRDNPAVFLPEAELNQRIRTLQSQDDTQ